MLIRDGLLADAGAGCVVDADLSACPHGRARALAAAAPVRDTVVAAAMWSAAWVYLGGCLTRPLHFAVPLGLRPPRAAGLYTGRCMPLPPAALRRIGPLWVTCPEATAVELARFAPQDAAHPVIEALGAAGLLTRDATFAWLRKDWARPRSRIACTTLIRALAALPA